MNILKEFLKEKQKLFFSIFFECVELKSINEKRKNENKKNLT
jgi:hypothetical protein